MSNDSWVTMPRKHAQALLNDLNARIDHAHATAVPVFPGIVALHTALSDNATALRDAELREAIRNEIVNTPETAGFMTGVPIEAMHQRERWAAGHDAGKTPFDWFWLVGYLAQKAASSQVAGDTDKALHHTISTAAALANWHLSITGADTSMRPGIAKPAGEA